VALGRLEINVGNIYHRQDRFEESIAHYERAYAGLMPYKDAEGIAVVLSNMAVCLISLNDFPRPWPPIREPAPSASRTTCPF